MVNKEYHDFISNDSTAKDVLYSLVRNVGKPVYVAYLPKYYMYVVASQPITPQLVFNWWNEDMDEEVSMMQLPQVTIIKG